MAPVPPLPQDPSDRVIQALSHLFGDTPTFKAWVKAVQVRQGFECKVMGQSPGMYLPPEVMRPLPHTKAPDPEAAKAKAKVKGLGAGIDMVIEGKMLEKLTPKQQQQWKAMRKEEQEALKPLLGNLRSEAELLLRSDSKRLREAAEHNARRDIILNEDYPSDERAQGRFISSRLTPEAIQKAADNILVQKADNIVYSMLSDIQEQGATKQLKPLYDIEETLRRKDKGLQQKYDDLQTLEKKQEDANAKRPKRPSFTDRIRGKVPPLTDAQAKAEKGALEAEKAYMNAAKEYVEAVVEKAKKEKPAHPPHAELFEQLMKQKYGIPSPPFGGSHMERFERQRREVPAPGNISQLPHMPQEPGGSGHPSGLPVALGPIKPGSPGKGNRGAA